MSKKINAGALALASVVLPQLVNAATEVSPPMVVTATRTAQTVDASLASVSVVTRADIERLQANSLEDVLKRLAGVKVVNNGGKGKATSVFMRGTESDHVLVLIDGVKVGSATLGSTAFQFLPIDSIERIEVVRGPRSALYGSEAIGGVIQIFTRQAEGAFTPSFSISAGSHDSYMVSGGFSGRSGDSWFGANVSHEESGGFNACDSGPGFGCFTSEPDDDRFRNESGSFRLGHRFADAVDVELHGLYSEGNTHFDGGFSPFFFVPNETDFIQQVIGGKASFSLIKNWEIKLSGGQSRDRSKNRQSVDGSTSFFNTQRDSFSWQNDLTLSEGHLLTIGYDYQDDKVASNTAYAETSRTDEGLFAQYQGEFGNHDVLIALRKDDNEQFGNHTTGNIGWGYTLNNGLRVTASFGKAFKAPTFNELYFPFFGDPDLDSERSKTYELGFGRAESWGDWNISLYKTDVKDLIAYDPTHITPNLPFGGANNVSKARIRGLELTVSTDLAGWNLNSALTLMDPENRESGSANKGNVLARRAQQSFNLDADHDFGKGRLGFTIFAEGRRFDDAANRRRLGGYMTLDLRAEYPICQNWLLQGKVTNLLNKDYRTAAGFNTDGTAAMLTVRYQP